ncbi:MAG: tetratricopeptide repeat protein, partial [Saprospiraceae bacterium]
MRLPNNYQKLILVICLLINVVSIPSAFTQSIEQRLEAVEEYLATNKYDTAINELKSLTALINQEEQPKLWTTVQTKLGVSYQTTDNYAQAEQVLQDAVTFSAQQSEQDSLTALLWHKLGVNSYYQNDYADAVDFYEKALQLRQEFLSADHIDIIKGQRNIGTAWLEAKQFWRARPAFETSLQLHLNRSGLDSSLIANTYRDLGYTLTQLNDLAPAKKYLFSALEFYTELYLETAPWEMSAIYQDLTNLFLAQ